VDFLSQVDEAELFDHVIRVYDANQNNNVDVNRLAKSNISISVSKDDGKISTLKL
jgi:hypothetical protein